MSGEHLTAEQLDALARRVWRCACGAVNLSLERQCPTCNKERAREGKS